MVSVVVLSLLLASNGALANGTVGTATALDWEEDTPALGVISAAGDVTVRFAATGALSVTKTCELIVGGSSPTSLFKGNLSRYTAARFQICGDGHVPEGTRLKLSRQVAFNARRVWENDTPAVSATVGEWTINTVPFLVDQGWGSSWLFENWAYSQADTFAMDIKAVDSMTLAVSPDGGSAQSYSISGFQLISDSGATVAAQLTPVEAYFPGVTRLEDLSDAQRAQDTDGDGMSDLNEIIAGMNPHDASSVFEAKIAKTASGGNKVTWRGVFGATYGIMRSTDLGSAAFDLIPASDRYADATGDMEYVDESPVPGKANFYKVVKY